MNCSILDGPGRSFIVHSSLHTVGDSILPIDFYFLEHLLLVVAQRLSENLAQCFIYTLLLWESSSFVDFLLSPSALVLNVSRQANALGCRKCRCGLAGLWSFVQAPPTLQWEAGTTQVCLSLPVCLSAWRHADWGISTKSSAFLSFYGGSFGIKRLRSKSYFGRWLQ